MGRELEYTATEYYSPCFHRQVFDDAAEKRMREGEEKERERERRGNWGKNCREVRENLDAKGSVERKKKGSPRRRKRTFSSLLPSRQRLMVYCLSTQLPRVSLGSQRNEYTDVSFRDISQEKRTKFPVCS